MPGMGLGAPLRIACALLSAIGFETLPLVLRQHRNRSKAVPVPGAVRNGHGRKRNMAYQTTIDLGDERNREGLGGAQRLDDELRRLKIRKPEIDLGFQFALLAELSTGNIHPVQYVGSRYRLFEIIEELPVNTIMRAEGSYPFASEIVLR